MAAFGAPIEQADHADRALAAARQMTSDALTRFNRYLEARGLGGGFRMGLGLNSGEVMAGNVGSERRLEYAVIGDTTNTASRIEAMTKELPYMVLLADATKSMLTRETVDLVEVDTREVRGRRGVVRLWSIESAAVGRFERTPAEVERAAYGLTDSPPATS
jgi:adenylate cyclase